MTSGNEVITGQVREILICHAKKESGLYPVRNRGPFLDFNQAISLQRLPCQILKNRCEGRDNLLEVSPGNTIYNFLASDSYI